MSDDWDKMSPEERKKVYQEQLASNERMRKSINDTTVDLKRQSSTWGDIKKNIEESNNVFVLYGRMLKNAAYAMQEFTLNTSAQYEVAEKIAKEYKKVSFELGLTTKGGNAMAESFKKAMPLVERLGMDASDLGEIITKIAEDSGRIKMFNSGDLETMALMSKSFRLGEDATGEMVDRFDLMGISVETMGKRFTDTFEDASKMGLNSQKVVEVLSDNFASMQRMSFAGGTKAMTEMAKLAVDMRMDVSSMLGMAEKFYNPEQAIEAAAELQLMGGDIAAAFGDPFEVMYLARNKPEELAKKVQSMTENMVQFNEQTGEYELPPEALQQLTFMSDKLGQNKDQIIDMAFQSSKLKDVKDAMGDSTIFSEEEQSAVAQMAKFNKKTGQFEVTIGEQTFDINDNADQIQQAMKDGLLEREKTGEEGQKALVDNSFTTNDLLQNMIDEFKAGIAVKTDFYEVGENILNQTVTTMSDGNKDLIDAFGKVVEKAKKGEGSNVLLKELLDPSKQTSLGGMISKQVEAIYDLTTKLVEGGDINDTGGLETKIKDASDAIDNMTDAINKVMGGGKEIKFAPFKDLNGKNIAYEEHKDFISRPGQPVQSFVANDTLIGAKKGGPIDKLLNNSLGGNNVGGEIKIPDFNINVNLNGANGLNANDLGKTLMPILKAKILEKMGDQIFVKGGKEKDGFPTNAT